jgi:hypothetical protein
MSQESASFGSSTNSSARKEARDTNEFIIKISIAYLAKAYAKRILRDGRRSGDVSS